MKKEIENILIDFCDKVVKENKGIHIHTDDIKKYCLSLSIQSSKGISDVSVICHNCRGKRCVKCGWAGETLQFRSKLSEGSGWVDEKEKWIGVIREMLEDENIKYHYVREWIDEHYPASSPSELSNQTDADALERICDSERAKIERLKTVSAEQITSLASEKALLAVTVQEQDELIERLKEDNGSLSRQCVQSDKSIKIAEKHIGELISYGERIKQLEEGINKHIEYCKTISLKVGIDKLKNLLSHKTE